MHKTWVFLTNNMGIRMKNTRSDDFCMDQIDVITNFAVIKNVIIKRVHCISISSADISKCSASCKCTDKRTWFLLHQTINTCQPSGPLNRTLR